MIGTRPLHELKPLLKLSVCVLLVTAAATAIVAGAGYEISIPGSTEVPTQTVETDELDKNEFEINAFAVQEQGE